MANTARLVIDPITRKISTKSEKIRLVKNDNNSMRITFEMPRYVRGHDMSNCSTAEVHYDNISIDRKQKHSDVYVVTDIVVAPEDDQTINFSWLVSRAATQIVGNVDFSLHFGCNEDPSLEYAWHTTTYSGIVVLEGKHNTQSVVEKHPDLVASILDYVDKKLSELDAVEIAQETGDSTEAVMSQKATTDALGGKVDKITDASKVHATDENGNPTGLAYGMGLFANSIVQRTGKGDVLVPDKPTSISGAVNMKYVDDKVALLQRDVSALEEAGRGMLYSYPLTECVTSCLTLDKNTLLHGLLCRLGGTLPKSKNLLPEHILTTYRSDTLSVTWDHERACLVFNGSLNPSEGEVSLAVLYHPAAFACYAGGSFYRGGKIHGAQDAEVLLSFQTENGEEIPVSLAERDSTFTDFFLETDAERFAKITISTDAPVVFEEYRCNLFLEETDSLAPVVYSPFDPKDRLHDLPRYVTTRGVNRWEGEQSLRGKGTVRFTAKNTIVGSLAFISFYGTTDAPTENIKLIVRSEGGGVYVASRQKNKHSYVVADIHTPIQSITFYNTHYEDDESPYTLEIRDLQVECTEDRRGTPLPYSEPFSFTHALPESLSRYRDDFIGLGDERCNYLDFEHGVFVRNLRRFTVDHTLNFVTDSTAPNRYYASVALPDALVVGDFFPTSILEALPIDFTTEEGCIWFVEGTVVLQSALFPTVEVLKEFLALHPIEVLYVGEPQFDLLTEEECDELCPLFLPLGPRGTVELTALSGAPAECFLQLQYQLKNTTEVSA